MVLGFIAWVKALGIVCLPFIKIAALWFSYQLGIGYVAWATARFYSTHCAGPGLNGFITSLFTMGSPICISAWISHAAFVVIYVTAFVAAVVFGVMWVWKRLTNDKTIKNNQKSDEWFKEASKYLNTYYGQLAFSEVYPKESFSLGELPKISEKYKKEFNKNNLIKIILLLNELDKTKHAKDFLKHLANLDIKNGRLQIGLAIHTIWWPIGGTKLCLHSSHLVFWCSRRQRADGRPWPAAAGRRWLAAAWLAG